VTITEFLLARIAEDEAAICDGWDSDGKARVAVMWTGGEPGYTTVASDHGDGEWVADGQDVIDPRHVRVLFDPARVIAECEAKRRIVEEHGEREVASLDPGTRGQMFLVCRRCCDPMNGRQVVAPCPTLCILTDVYADHPDYRDEWKP
jgi:hypothetical protein